MRQLFRTVPSKLAIALAAVVGILLATQAALAASQLCRDLEAELVRVERGGEKTTQTRRYARAVDEQRRELRRTRQQARRNGCAGSGFVLFDRSAFNDRCDPINATIEKMELNLAKLENNLAKLSSRANAESRRSAILARIEANRCREDTHVRRLPDPIETTARRDYSLMDKLFGGRLRHSRPDGNSGFMFPGDDDGLQRIGNYRTLCVRTCDGYYFPISFSTAGDMFGRDEQACQALCPGVEVQLYSHRVPDEEPEDMVSVTGEPYSALPMAFAYRDPNFQTPKGCACRPAKDYAIIAGENAEEKGKADEEQAYVPEPRPRPDPGLDPESAQNIAGGLTVAKVRLLLKPRPAVGETPPKRRIRVVGPAFLPDPEEAIDLKSPGRSAVR
ncbi:MAG: DUF2865 domain-containing protein [Notoacmeibacter sp.]|nr:DUF2865 domain-containing protein [Notoacmeibacter sp.]